MIALHNYSMVKAFNNPKVVEYFKIGETKQKIENA